MTRVLIVAGAAVVRAGLESLVRSSPSFTVAGVVGETSRLPEQMAELEPDLVLIDWSNPDQRLLQATLQLDSESPIPVAILTDEPGSEWLASLRAGAGAVLPRDADPAQILAAMEAVAAGLTVFDPRVLDSALPAIRTVPHAPPPSQPLTPRELEVLELLAEGLGNKTIAWKLGISEHTVKFHIASLFDKLNASSRAEAVAIGIRHGMIML